VNQICRELENEGISIRKTGKCKSGGEWLLINTLIDSAMAPIEIQSVKTITPSIFPDSNSYHEQWHWEGNVQRKIVDYLGIQNIKVLHEANTATREAGVDIEARLENGTILLITVKGYPIQTNQKPFTQARHWFGSAMFDLILYRNNYPEAQFGIGLPAGFSTYINLAKRIAWFGKAIPLKIYWVSKDGKVTEETI
jgi:hypothetical protein